MAAAPPAAAGEFSVIHQFAGGAAGGDPAGPMVMASRSAFSGVATSGRLGSGGGVFQLSETGPDQWQEVVLHSFPPSVTVGPGLTLGRRGALYGSQQFNSQGGSVFRLLPRGGAAWDDQVLHTFAGGLDAPQGATPGGTLLVDARGDVFGTTWAGGDVTGQYTCRCGVANELSPAAGGAADSETVLHVFSNPPDAGLRIGGLTAGPDGTLFGTASQGGTGGCLDGSGVVVIGCGAIYSLSFGGSAWSERVLNSFTRPPENLPFDTLTLGADGALYGVAGFDIYRLLSLKITGGSRRHQVLYEFPDGLGGIAPAASVVFDRAGWLYGLTRSFGLDGIPTLYRLSPAATSDAPWLLTTLHRFVGSGGLNEQPSGALLRSRNGAFYGTVGSGNGQIGYVFAYSP